MTEIITIHITQKFFKQHGISIVGNVAYKYAIWSCENSKVECSQQVVFVRSTDISLWYLHFSNLKCAPKINKMCTQYTLITV